MPDNISYFHDGFTFPKARGRGLVVETNHGIAEDLLLPHTRVRGRCEAWAAHNNAASLRAHSKMGFEVYGSRRVVVIGPARVRLGQLRAEGS